MVAIHPCGFDNWRQPDWWSRDPEGPGFVMLPEGRGNTPQGRSGVSGVLTGQLPQEGIGTTPPPPTPSPLHRLSARGEGAEAAGCHQASSPVSP